MQYLTSAGSPMSCYYCVCGVEVQSSPRLVLYERMSTWHCARAEDSPARAPAMYPWSGLLALD